MGRLSRIRNWPELFERGHFHPNEVAYLCEVDATSLRRFLRKHFGAAPLEIFHSCRLLKAAFLILTTNCTIKEVATKCGYQQASHFSWRFKCFFGVPPSEFCLLGTEKCRELIAARSLSPNARFRYEMLVLDTPADLSSRSRGREVGASQAYENLLQ